ncbi:Required for respiratory growth protein 9, mitochondrial [Madurella mycetomatis]|uniref:Required for respiratory growth protein 9, mitochondrial n=1 Tax=Madurella mycetomatis TaxID=100816 RepID=A0A175W8R0_9PEZI|nr:Required for respiratory growth protein 9, mitochondrial [Madurella mycetomatis]
MNCPCQTAALRIFVKNIAHVHVPARTATSRFSRHQVFSQTLYRTSARFDSLQRTATALPNPSSRSFHTSSSRYDAAEPAHAAEDHADGPGKREDAARPAEATSHETKLPPNITYRTEPQEAKIGDGEVNEEKTKPDKPTKAELRKERRREKRNQRRNERRREARMKAKTKKGAAKQGMAEGEEPVAISDEGKHIITDGEKHTTKQEKRATKQNEKYPIRQEKKDATKAKKYGGKNDEKGKAKGKDKDGEPPVRPKEPWMAQKNALKKKFPEGWKPRKKLSPDAMAGIRALHARFPKEYTTDVLAEKFEVSPEAIRRILKSKWAPTPEEEERRQQRWFNRGKRVWALWAELGKKPPRKWRAEGVTRDPKWNLKRPDVGEKTYNREAAAQAEWELSETMLG